MNRCIAFLHWFSIVVAVNALVAALIIFTNLLFGCAVWGQEIERRGAVPPVPPLPRQISRTISTNDQGEEITVTVKKPQAPPALIQSRYMTNTFEVMCTRCRVTALRVPKRVEEVGVTTVPDGDELDLTLYFVCCSKEFRAKSKVFIETPIAKLVR